MSSVVYTRTCSLVVTTEPSDERNLSSGFIQLRIPARIKICSATQQPPGTMFVFVFCGALQLVGYVAPGQITESQIMEYRVRKGLSNRFSCWLYVGQDISLSCRCSKQYNAARNQ